MSQNFAFAIHQELMLKVLLNKADLDVDKILAMPFGRRTVSDSHRPARGRTGRKRQPKVGT